MCCAWRRASRRLGRLGRRLQPALAHGHRLAREARLVHDRDAAQQHEVGGRHPPAPLDRDDVARHELGRVHAHHEPPSRHTVHVELALASLATRACALRAVDVEDSHRDDERHQRRRRDKVAKPRPHNVQLELVGRGE